MGCMKCGRDTAEGDVFCRECISGMQRYPVKPNVTVHLPVKRAEQAVRRPAPRRKALSPEEQIKRLRGYNRVLSFLLAIAMMLMIFFGYISVLHFLEEERFLPGQNYSSIETLPG